ncbi:amino acid permease [Pseudoclavibacter sp. RFBB5]|uniref:amino acid permease n=1 Tax=Pseudoclavibacter sp. RFBB5 TaxID=2080574 RepID=UPI000CE902E9|nr:amino acid permease [Pseudoclavibacter sp. RFBB5]PPG27978.1 D-serine/D-alanine/glycine transporter [Pseudoclavibacter sp. RFBB5]
MTGTAGSGPDSAATDGVTLERALSNRHIQLIAVGGAIGTGLFLGAGIGINKSGPSILLVYVITGAMLFVMMRAMGELLLSNLGYRTFQDFAAAYLGEWARFFLGWSYWLCLISIAAADMVGVQTYARYWWPDLPGWVPMVVAIAFVLALNLIAVRAFGEAEFWFALVKIVTILGLIVVGIILIVTAFTAPSGDRASITHLWDDGGFFPNGFVGFLAGFQIAVFSFGCIELIGTTAAEAKDPEKNLPKAINQVPLRILFFYVGALAVIMCVTPWSKIEPGTSPFVALFVLTGFGGAAALINAVVMSSAVSAANSGFFSSSRMAYGLATTAQAPARLGRLTKTAVPGNALLLSCAVVLVAGSLGLIFDDAFQLVTAVSSILFIFVWAMILVSYLAYRRQRPDLHTASTYRLRWGVPLAWSVLGFFAFILVLLAVFEDTRGPLLLTPIWFGILGVAWAMVRRRSRQTSEAATHRSPAEA